ncbi:BMC domain-containing protein, partial [Clostridium sp. CMCC3678]
MIEIKGLASAITVADTMAKVANIQLVDTEKAKGFGWITVKVEGDVAAVNAA